MGDLHQWRLKMHTSKSWISPILETDEKPRLSESASQTSASMPRRKQRPRLKSYFGNHVPQPAEWEQNCLDKHTINGAAISSPNINENLATSKLALKLPKDATTSIVTTKSMSTTTSFAQDIDMSVSSLVSRLISNPGLSLSLQDNSLVLRMIESHRDLSEKAMALENEIAGERKKTEKVQVELQQLEAGRVADEKDFRAEIKRLEMIIAQGKRGMSDLVKTRQGSIIRKSRYSREETVVEGTEKGGGQMKTLEKGEVGMFTPKRNKSPTKESRLIPQSPSWRMTDLSRKLRVAAAQRQSRSAVPSHGQVSSSSSLEDSKNGVGLIYVGEEASYFAEAECSSISSHEDPSPNESQRSALAGKTTEDGDMEMIWKMGSILALRKGLPVIPVVNRLTCLFSNCPEDHEAPVNSTANVAKDDTNGLFSPRHTKQTFSNYNYLDSLTPLHSELEFVNTSELCRSSPMLDHRRFSFCPNDDNALKIRSAHSSLYEGPGALRLEDKRPISTPPKCFHASDTSNNFSVTSSNNSIAHKLPAIENHNGDSRDNKANLAKDHQDQSIMLSFPNYTTSGEPAKKQTFAHPSANNDEFANRSLLDATPRSSIVSLCSRISSSGSQRSAVTAIWRDDDLSDKKGNSDQSSDQHSREGSSCDIRRRCSHQHNNRSQQSESAHSLRSRTSIQMSGRNLGTTTALPTAALASKSSSISSERSSPLRSNVGIFDGLKE